MSLTSSSSMSPHSLVRTVLPRAALVVAFTTSAVALADAAVRGLHAGSSPIDEQQAGWVNVVVSILHAIAYGVLAGLLVSRADLIDAGSRARRWVRRVLACSLTVLALTFAALVLGVEAEGQSPLSMAVGVLAGTAFAAMFVLSCVLGLSLLARRPFRAAAWMLSAQLLVLAGTLLLAALGSPFAHPAYLETASAFGLALLGRPHEPRASEAGGAVFKDRRTTRARSGSNAT